MKTGPADARIPELRIQLAPVAESVERAGRRLVDLLGKVEDPTKQVSGLTWSLAELAAHLAARTELYVAFLAGSVQPEGGVSGMAAENRDGIQQRIGRSFEENVDEVRSNVASYVAMTRGRLGADPFPWYGGLAIDVATGTGILLSELLVHGLDAARTLGTRWRIGVEDARTIIRASAVLTPAYVDPVATRGVRATYRVAVRGGPTFVVRVEDGAATVEPPGGETDCTIRIDPVALVLLSFGRINRVRAVAIGRLLVTGRKPWRALAFERSFLPP